MSSFIHSVQHLYHVGQNKCGCSTEPDRFSGIWVEVETYGDAWQSVGVFLYNMVFVSIFCVVLLQESRLVLKAQAEVECGMKIVEVMVQFDESFIPLGLDENVINESQVLYKRGFGA